MSHNPEIDYYCELPQLFRYNPEQETRDEYLTKAAVWIDVIERGTEEERRDIGIQLGDFSLSYELKNYVFSVMNDTLEKLGKSNYRKLVKENCYEEFMNEYRIQVWRAFYRYNNPKYIKTDRIFRFSTYAIHYLKQAAWQVHLQQYGVSDHLFRNCKKVKRAEEMLAMKNGLSHDQVSDSEIREYITAKENVDIGESEIRTIRNILAPVSDIPADYYKPVEEILFDDVNDSIVTGILEDFVEAHRSLQMFVFLQNFGFCSEFYHDMTVQDLANDQLFIRLCRSDLSARKKIRSERLDENTGILKDSFSCTRTVRERLFLKEKYIFNMRVIMREEFSTYICKNKLKPYELRDNLSSVMYRTWENIMLLYEIEGK